MKKLLKISCLITLLSLSVGYCLAEEKTVSAEKPIQEATLGTIQSVAPVSANANIVPNTTKTDIPVSLKTDTAVQPPILTAPVVEQPKRLIKQANRKVDLHAIIFDPAVTVKEPPNEEEMTQAEIAKYKINEALKGEVSAVSTKGLFADQTKMTFEKGPIDNIIPWFDYNGYFSNLWTGDTYQNSLYGINFADVGFNVNMRDKKTYVRFMFSPVKTYDGKNYFQTFFADNYITYKITKNNTILLGNTWVPLGIEGKESPLVWQFFNRSQTSMNYSSVRTLGTKLMGNYKYVDYQLGFSSAGRGFTDWFPGPEFTSWFEFKPLANTNGKYGKLTIGTGFNGGNSTSHYAVATGAINYEYKRLRAITEFGMADGSNGALGYSPYKSQGINGTLAYRITPRIQALVRYDQFDPNTEKSNDMRREYTAGINYFVKGQALKLMLNYVYYTVENGTYGSKILVGTQIVL